MKFVGSLEPIAVWPGGFEINDYGAIVDQKRLLFVVTRGIAVVASVALSLPENEIKQLINKVLLPLLNRF